MQMGYACVPALTKGAFHGTGVVKADREGEMGYACTHDGTFLSL